MYSPHPPPLSLGERGRVRGAIWIKEYIDEYTFCSP